MRFVSRSVITGFVNALAILIFLGQLPELINVPWMVYAMTAAVVTHDLAKGVFVGVLLSAVFFAAKVSRLFRVDAVLDANGAHRHYAVHSLDKVVLKFRREGNQVQVTGMNEASATLVDRFGVHERPDADINLSGH